MRQARALRVRADSTSGHWIGHRGSGPPGLFEQLGRSCRDTSWLTHLEATECCKPRVYGLTEVTRIDPDYWFREGLSEDFHCLGLYRSAAYLRSQPNAALNVCIQVADDYAAAHASRLCILASSAMRALQSSDALQFRLSSCRVDAADGAVCAPHQRRQRSLEAAQQRAPRRLQTVRWLGRIDKRKV